MAKYVSTEEFLTQNGICPEGIRCASTIEAMLWSKAITTDGYLFEHRISKEGFIITEGHQASRIQYFLISQERVLKALSFLFAKHLCKIGEILTNWRTASRRPL
jgi:hypothetical protein